MDAGVAICLDNYFTGRKENISQWIGHPRFELVRHDVTEPIKLEVDRICIWLVQLHRFTSIQPS